MSNATFIFFFREVYCSLEVIIQRLQLLTDLYKTPNRIYFQNKSYWQ